MRGRARELVNLRLTGNGGHGRTRRLTAVLTRRLDTDRTDVQPTGIARRRMPNS